MDNNEIMQKKEALSQVRQMLARLYSSSSDSPYKQALLKDLSNKYYVLLQTLECIEDYNDTICKAQDYRTKKINIYAEDITYIKEAKATLLTMYEINIDVMLGLDSL